MKTRIGTLLCLQLLIFVVGCAARGDGDAHVAKGMQFYLQREFAQAIPEFEKALDLPLRFNTRSDVMTTIGNCCVELERYDEALTWHDQAIKEDPANFRAYVNKGVVCRLIGEYEQAEALYLKALELAPEYAELHASMGALAIYQGDHDAAIEHLERALELDDTLAVSHSNLALAYATVGRFDDADRELKAAIVRGYHQPEVIRERMEQLRLAFESQQ